MVLACGLAACSMGVQLSQPPNLYLDGRNYPASLVPEVLQVVDAPIFYVTDRAPVRTEGRVTGYGTGRSDAMAFGATQIRFGAVDWEDLVARTHVDRGGRISRLDLVALREITRFPDIPLPARRQSGELRVTPEARSEYEAITREFQNAIRAEVQRTGNRRILVYVHGVSNEFDNSVQTLANLWHFTGRRSIPVSFTWPAGNAGLLGYFRDREAADFSVYHAKEFLRMLAEIPEVEDIDIVAHSRGTSVMTQALREMVIYNRGKGLRPKLAMKTGTLILAAADLDIGVVRQRLASERVSEAFEQINIYVNPDDVALRLSSFLTKYPRVGVAGADDFKPNELAVERKQGLTHFIRVEGASGSGSHSYFRNNPAVLSDIVLALRTRAFPGGTLRPLEEDPDTIWRLQPNYPLERLPNLIVEVER
ncbi:alpha/beta hydrolase [Sulfitobacter aestuariivivens]|uniref:alpha/beta hydrolase n=1 Tax=Sulfitobacter aestuariivivens TaxID=2766981 RepID=UPI003618D82F